MEPNDNTTNFLLETIRKELVSIIDQGSQPKKLTPEEELPTGAKSGASVPLNSSEGSPISASGCNLSPGRSDFMETHCYRTIDEDLHKMHLNLKESYELFQNIGDRFENINFGCLKTRIKDLHLSDKSSVTIKTIADDLKNTFDQKYIDNRLDELTKDVGSKFRNHPGEFGDIPELSEFFRACTQLQHGLERLTRQHNDAQTLTKRMSHAIDMSFNRVGEIQQKIAQNSISVKEEPQDKGDNRK